MSFNDDNGERWASLPCSSSIKSSSTTWVFPSSSLSANMMVSYIAEIHRLAPSSTEEGYSKKELALVSWWPRCRCQMWKMCFSSEGCVTYAQRCEAKALHASV